jgi:N6-adenosine-specific RNA methylase IME4
VTWEGLNPPYATIVADPPWEYPEGWPMSNGQGQKGNTARQEMPYSGLSVGDIAALPVGAIAAPDSVLFLWTTNRYLRHAWDVAEAWGFTPSQMLTWCKPPRGLGPGGVFANTTEFCLFGRRGSVLTQRHDSTWFIASRSGHSVKPAAFLDLVEQVSPGPYVELFARQPRLGWDHWGHGYEGQAA